MFQDMMDRIEDDSIRYLYFLRIETGNIPLPYPETDDEDDDVTKQPEPEPQQAAIAAQREQARNEVMDLTRNIQKKKDRELAALQFAGGETSTTVQTVSNTVKVGRNEPCPCGSGRKYKKCHGA